MLAHPLRPPLPPTGDKVLTAQAIMNNKLKAFPFIIKLPMRAIPISILKKKF
ncbi:hypothetical protein [Klebsiella pneumoniae]|uniref:hypothetical protein n=1 Tax=Klebsiella pneumoniae TaxID=573 RepID=UPI001788D9DE|nr:hypothetical protein [Klebsiella pneumoniae]